MNVDSLYDFSESKGVEVKANLVQGAIHIRFNNDEGDELGFVMKPKTARHMVDVLRQMGVLDCRKCGFSSVVTFSPDELVEWARRGARAEGGRS